jgi:endonuclease YncB( thermonuclease family)
VRSFAARAARRTGRRVGRSLGRRLGLFLAAALAGPGALDLASGAWTRDEGARLAHVVDGDTVAVWRSGEGVVRARLDGLDAPEIFSPGCAAEWAAGQAATLRLRTLLYGAGLREWRFGRDDKWGRPLLRLTLDGRDAAALLIAEGHARPYDGGRRLPWPACG